MPRTVTADFAGQTRYEYSVRLLSADDNPDGFPWESVATGERPSLRSAKLAAGKAMHARIDATDRPQTEIAIDEVRYTATSFHDEQYGHVDDADREPTGKQWVGYWNSDENRINYEEYA